MEENETTPRYVILVVDDDPAVRNLIRTMLEHAGYLALSAYDGEDALELITSYRGHIDLIITDVNMPRMDGLSLAERIREKGLEIKILVISGKDSGAFKAAAGKLPFLEKPFSLEPFLNKVAEILSQRS